LCYFFVTAQHVWLLCCALLLLGCGVKSAREANHRATEKPALQRTVSTSVQSQDEADGAGPSRVAGVGRQIITEAEIRLVVPDFAETERAVPRLVKEHAGYLSDVSVERTTGERRSGRWQVRIPVVQFDAFLNAVAQLGVPETRHQTAQDMTEEFVDLNARITNEKRLEERILKLLDDSPGKIKDVIEVEHELARVRGEIERAEGRLRYLTDRTAFSTVTIVVREQRDYVPPAAPTFLIRLSQAWGSSLLALGNCCADVAVASVFAFPWLLVLSVVVTPPLWYIHRYKVLGNRAA
jgi:hypothetical protein